jgi:hypothetical protein
MKKKLQASKNGNFMTSFIAVKVAEVFNADVVIIPQRVTPDTMGRYLQRFLMQSSINNPILQQLSNIQISPDWYNWCLNL